ncbi:Vitamin B12 import ATP-binding protein BtuD [Streptomyces griseorubiginosus]
MCAVRGLTKTYPAVRGRRGAPGTPEVRATDDVRLDIRRGEIFGLLGPNGAGKTTLVRQLTGLMRPDSGSVEILGHDIVRHPDRASRILAYLGQESERPGRTDRLPRRRDHRTVARPGSQGRRGPSGTPYSTSWGSRPSPGGP